MGDFGGAAHSTNEVRDCQFYNMHTPVVINGSPNYPMQIYGQCAQSDLPNNSGRLISSATTGRSFEGEPSTLVGCGVEVACFECEQAGA